MGRSERRCMETEGLLHRLVDGELGAREEDLVRQELGTCEACRKQFESLQKLRALVREVYTEESNSVDLDAVLPQVMQRIQKQPVTLGSRISDWLDKYRLGLASPLVPMGVGATAVAGIIALGVIYLSTADDAANGTAVKTTGMAWTAPATESGTQVALNEGEPEQDATGSWVAGAEGDRERRRPPHDEKGFGKNKCYVEGYNVETGVVLIDMDTEGDQPTVVWHYSDEDEEPSVEEDNRI